jgi:hypothetical protein
MNCRKKTSNLCIREKQHKKKGFLSSFQYTRATCQTNFEFQLNVRDLYDSIWAFFLFFFFFSLFLFQGIHRVEDVINLFFFIYRTLFFCYIVASIYSSSEEVFQGTVYSLFSINYLWISFKMIFKYIIFGADFDKFYCYGCDLCGKTF